MARPARVASPALIAIVGEDQAKHLVDALPEQTKDLDREANELLRTGELRAVRFQLQLRAAQDMLERKAIADRFEDLTRQLAKIEVQQAILDRKLDQLVELHEQAIDGHERNWLESHGCVAQANEVIRAMQSDLRQLPGQSAAAVAAALGVVLGRLLEVPPAVPAPIVLVSRERGEAAA